MNRRQEKRDRAVAAAVTAGITLALLLALFFGSLSWDRAALAQTSVPETQPEEELFIEPELLELGEENAVTADAPAPAPKGEPEPAETDRAEIVEPGENPGPAPVKPKVVTQKQKSPVKEQEPPKTDKERQKAQSAVADKFLPKNGSKEGSTGGSGAGGTGVGISGSARGRTFLGCPKPDVALRHKAVVKVNVVIDASGKVVSASASGSADASIRRKCEQAARGARWTEKKGVSETRGTITFTITPR